MIDSFSYISDTQNYIEASRIKVSEIFFTLQGEGVSIGAPSVFLRLATCNLHCVWCDKKYTWMSENNPNNNIKHALKEILKFKCKRLILTGGEPTFQHNDEDLLKLLKILKGKGFYIETETNGTIIPNPKFVSCISQWNVSPKLESSCNEKSLRENPAAFRFYNILKNSWFKFVIKSPKDLKEVLKLAKKYKISKDKILLMPEATTKEELRKKSDWLIKICMKNNLRFSYRLHIGIGIR